MLVAMLAVIVVSATVTVTASVVIQGQRQTRFDEQFETSLQVAEHGLNRMLAVVQAEPDASAHSLPTQTLADGSSYTATATKTGNSWTVQATGTAKDGTTRTVRASIARGTVFNLAAFGKFFADFNGGNGADSFNSAVAGGSDICTAGGLSTDYVTNPSASSASDVEMCHPTNNGVVATNGRLKLLGQTVTVTDRAEIHYAREVVPAADRLAGATGYCDGVPALCSQMSNANATNPAAATSPGDVLRYYADPIELPPITACQGYTATGSFNGTGALAPGVHAFTDATLTSTTVLNGTAANPVILCLTGKLTVPNGEVVNFMTSPTHGYRVPKPAGSLYILSTYSGAGAGLDFGNHASMSAAVYAPDASFAGGAQGNIYGSLVASSIDNNGGWNFHYDEALASSTVNAPVQIDDWVEVPD